MSDQPKCAMHAKDAAEAQRWIGKPCVVCGRTSERFPMGAVVTVEPQRSLSHGEDHD